MLTIVYALQDGFYAFVVKFWCFIMFKNSAPLTLLDFDTLCLLVCLFVHVLIRFMCGFHLWL